MSIHIRQGRGATQPFRPEGPVVIASTMVPYAKRTSHNAQSEFVTPYSRGGVNCI